MQRTLPIAIYQLATELRKSAATCCNAGQAADPPLVTVAPGAADLYADLFDAEGGGGGTLLKTQLAEVRASIFAALKRTCSSML